MNKGEFSKILSVIAACCVVSSCASTGPNAQRDATNGALLGAIAGGIIGHQSGRGLEGAALGAAAGGVGGGMIGDAKDKEQQGHY